MLRTSGFAGQNFLSISSHTAQFRSARLSIALRSVSTNSAIHRGIRKSTRVASRDGSQSRYNGAQERMLDGRQDRSGARARVAGRDRPRSQYDAAPSGGMGRFDERTRATTRDTPKFRYNADRERISSTRTGRFDGETRAINMEGPKSPHDGARDGAMPYDGQGSGARVSRPNHQQKQDVDDIWESQNRAEGRLTPRQRKYMRGGREEPFESSRRSTPRLSGTDFHDRGASRTPAESSNRGKSGVPFYEKTQHAVGGGGERSGIFRRYGDNGSSDSSSRKIEIPNRALRRASIYGHYENPPPNFKVPLPHETDSGGDLAPNTRFRDEPLSRVSSSSDDRRPRSGYRPSGDRENHLTQRNGNDIPSHNVRDLSNYSTGYLRSGVHAERSSETGLSYREGRRGPEDFGNGFIRQSHREPSQSIIRERLTEPEQELVRPEEDRRRPEWKARAPLSIPYTTPASEFLYGTSVITAALKSGRRKMYQLYLYDGENRANAAQDTVMRKLALSQGVEVSRVQGDWLRMMDKMSGGRPHNGYILEASPLPKLPVVGFESVPRPQASFKILLDHQSREEEAINGIQPMIKYQSGFRRFPFVLLLDGILDPGNLGAIMRTAYYLGIDAVAISNRNSAPFTPVTLKASAGASEDLPLMSISQPGSFIDNCQRNGWKFFAAVAPRSNSSATVPVQRPYYSTSALGSPIRDHPCVLILGGEGEGLRWNIQKKANYLVGIEGHRAGQGGVDSLNVSVAAGLLCEAFLRKPVQHTNEAFKKRISEVWKPGSDTIHPGTDTSIHAASVERQPHSNDVNTPKTIPPYLFNDTLRRSGADEGDGLSEHRLF